MFLYEFDAKPLIQLDDIKATLPSHEDLWENPNLVQQGNKRISDITLPGAMETIYMEKKLPPHLGEFSMALLVNAIYRNTIHVAAREQTRLNAWTPTAMAQCRSEQFSVLPSATSTTSKWRNSACDCLDVLHWPANSKAAQSLGSEYVIPRNKFHVLSRVHPHAILILLRTGVHVILALAGIALLRVCFADYAHPTIGITRFYIYIWPELSSSLVICKMLGNVLQHESRLSSGRSRIDSRPDYPSYIAERCTGTCDDTVVTVCWSRMPSTWQH
jgi:hypothetical protein